MSVPLLHRWLLAQAVVWLPTLLLLATDPAIPGILAFIVFAMFGSYVLLWRILGAGSTLADAVTAARFLGLMVLLFLVFWHRGIGLWLWSGMILVIVSDLFDGWCARRWGGSEAGAILDMEADQMTTLGLAAAGILHGGASVVLLMLPGFRYAYLFFLRLLGCPLHDPKPRGKGSQRGRIICATVMILLLVVLAPFSPAPVKTAATWVSVVALGYSFGSDAIYLARQRRRGVSPAGS